MKTPEKTKVFWRFQGVYMGALARNGLSSANTDNSFNPFCDSVPNYSIAFQYFATKYYKILYNIGMENWQEIG